MRKTIFTFILSSLVTMIFSQEKIQTENGVKNDFIYKNGFIGISKANPLFPLHVNGGNNRLPSLGYFQLFLENYESDYVGLAFAGINKVHGAIRIEDGDGFSFLTTNNLNPTLQNGTWKYVLRLKENGNIGIGTNTPSYPLDIYNSSQPVLRVYSDNSSGQGNPVILLNRGSEQTLRLEGFPNVEGRISAVAANVGFLTFYTGNNQERLRIKSNGNIGIGTPNPNYHFHAVGSDRARFEQTEGIIDIVAYGASGNDFDNTAGLFASNKTALIMTGLSGSGDIKFITRPSGYSERMIIKSNGNIGIGTSSPIAKLHLKSNDTSTEASILRLDNSGTGGNVAGLEFYSSAIDATTSNRVGRISGKFDGSSFTNARLSFYSMTTGNTLVETISLKNGKVGIGTVETGTHKLAVEGTIGAREIKVEVGTWSDFVFSKNYELRKLEEVESFIEENNHLPDIPSEKEVLENGIQVGEMNAKLLQKIEELTLYMIEQNKKTETLIEKVVTLESKNAALESEIRKLKSE